MSASQTQILNAHNRSALTLLELCCFEAELRDPQHPAPVTTLNPPSWHSLWLAAGTVPKARSTQPGPIRRVRNLINLLPLYPAIHVQLPESTVIPWAQSPGRQQTQTGGQPRGAACWPAAWALPAGCEL